MLRKDPFITGEYYHLYNRGIDKRVLYKNHRDFERFMMLLYIANSNLKNPIRLDDLINKQKKNFSEILILEKGTPLVAIGAWCIMDNHFHILVRQETDNGISTFMKKLGTAYSMYFNIKYQRTGSLFGGAFKSKLIGNDDRYMRHLLAYIHLNPLDIIAKDWKDTPHKNKKEKQSFLASYKYSSYSDYFDTNRLEKRILNLGAFPAYFEKTRDFDNFLNDYLEYAEENK